MARLKGDRLPDRSSSALPDLAAAQSSMTHEAGVQLPFGSMTSSAAPIAQDHVPSLEQFLADYMCCCPEGRPVVLSGENYHSPIFSRSASLHMLSMKKLLPSCRALHI